MFRRGRYIFLFIMVRFLTPAVAALKVVSPPTVSHSSESGKRMEIAGPVTAEIIRVIDGDTILVAAKPWPQQTMEVYVRLRGIDAPELKSACASTRDAGKQARAALASLTSEQGEIQLTHISGDKYFGRVVADISFSDGRNPAHEMLSAGYVSPYDGGRKSKACSSW
ncbi:thermonuclease family protein [Pararhizobium sp. DWP3-4]|uniref:thermonuclease family protein n=1 Tax=Pararhizobium sp. DWP3-4 TaxID=2804565 RepID=UPI003CF28AAC